MQISTGTIYKCDHCGKVQFRKCDMSKHEKWCKLNPENWHKCFQHCEHLIKTEEDYEGYSHDREEEYVGKKTVFTCAKTGQKMYSYLAEKRKLPVLNEKDTIRMPLECDLFPKPVSDWYEKDLPNWL